MCNVDVCSNAFANVSVRKIGAHSEGEREEEEE